MERGALVTLRIGGEPVKRGFLHALVGSVAASAFLAIVAIVSDDYLWWDEKALYSALTIAAASVCGLACGACLESARNRVLPLMGIPLATVAAALVLLIIWAELALHEHETLWRTTATLCVFAIAAAHLCLLSMARLAARFAWSLAAAYVVILFVAALLALLIWFEIGDEGMLRLLVAAVILDGAVTIVIPIFHRLSRTGSAVPPDRRREPDERHGPAERRAARGAERFPVDPVSEGPHGKRDALVDPRIGVESVKRGFLHALIGSVAVSAFLAIVAIISGDFDHWELRALLSASTIAAASVCGLACGACLESTGARALPLMGIALAIAAAAAVLLTIWVEPPLREYWLHWKTTATLCVFAVAVAHLCLLFMARLAARFGWSLVAAWVVILFVAGLLTTMMWFEIGGEGTWRLLTVAVVLDAAITVVIPIFHRLSRAQPAAGGNGSGRAGSGDVELRSEGI